MGIEHIPPKYLNFLAPGHTAVDVADVEELVLELVVVVESVVLVDNVVVERVVAVDWEVDVETLVLRVLVLVGRIVVDGGVYGGASYVA